ncbi:PREDICTED: uncharacterized protein LOC109328337 [Lupinus angustifolius]|uniref:uncharacterized protein LOC109328337 n=1 Tax=Lupinus angustifolius TaxID=3871 RepID=UPI00092F28E8|nr:PREDICTED: uncharacterized protein LOC109328337 [Lupinus angustifolius]
MSTISLRSILETSKLVGANYDDWYRNLRIILMHEKLFNTIDGPTMAAPSDLHIAEATEVYEKYKEDCLNVKWIILASMSSELWRQHLDMDPIAIIKHLKKMYGGQSRISKYQLSKDCLGPQCLQRIKLDLMC